MRDLLGWRISRRLPTEIMSLDTWPLAAALQPFDRILLAGAGGGFDIYSGLPLYVMLRNLGKEVHLANLSFAPMTRKPERQLAEACTRVDADLEEYGNYCPEFRLSTWFRTNRRDEVPIYCFPQVGVRPLRDAYQVLVDHLRLEAIVLVDGGTDSLMRGDEAGLGTPEEDVASIAAVSGCGIEAAFMATIGFGIDTFHGICHAQFLESVAALTASGDFLGVASVLPGSEGAEAFVSAVDFANERTIGRESIVQNSLASAVEGSFGDHHRTERTRGSHLWINPLMPVYWGFHLAGVARRNLYLERITVTESMFEITSVIQQFLGQIGTRGWDEMPV